MLESEENALQLGPLVLETDDVISATYFIEKLFKLKAQLNGSEYCTITVGGVQAFSTVALVSSSFFQQKFDPSFSILNVLPLSVSNLSEYLNEAISLGGEVMKATSNWALLEGPGGLKLLLQETLDDGHHTEREGAPKSTVLRGLDLQVNKSRKEGDPATKFESSRFQIQQPQEFPSLQIGICSNGGVTPVTPNTIDPYFKGFVFVALRNNPLNPATAHMFEGKQRLFEIQFQGMFKKAPQENLWMGGELAGPLQLSLITRGISKLCLSFAKGKSRGFVHYSLGNSNLTILPHLCGSFQTSADQLIRTPEGESPPPLGDSFNEPKEEREARYAGKRTVTLDTTSTYSFSFNSMYFNFPDWEVGNVPAAKGVDLHSFWGESTFRFSLYELGEEDVKQEHRVSTNRYYMTLELTHSVTAEKDNDLFVCHSPLKRSSIILKHSELENDEGFYDAKSTLASEDDSDSGSSSSSDTEEEQRSALKHRVSCAVKKSPGMLMRKVKTLRRNFSSPNFLVNTIANELENEANTESSVSDIFCPLWIEVPTSRKRDRSRRKMHVLYMVVKDGNMCLRSVKDFHRYFGRLAKQKNGRMAAHERKRRQLGDLLHSIDVSGIPSHQEALESFLRFETRHEKTFLTTTDKAPSRVGEVQLFVQVCRSKSTRQWVLENCALIEKYLMFFKRGKKKPSLTLPVSSILQIRLLMLSQFPVPGLQVLEISTLGRCHYIMLKESTTATTCINILQETIQRNREPPMSPEGSVPAFEDYEPDINMEDNFMMHSGEWKSTNNWILNCRKLSFLPRGFNELEDPCSLVEDLLQQVLSLGQSNQSSEGLLAFLDGACQLRNINLYSSSQMLDRDAKLAFFLNLYHLMVMHGFIVSGVPQNASYFVNFFTQVSYEFGDSMFSLTELEHCIIRAKMSRPQQLFAKIFLPQSTFDFASEVVDPRLVFAVNCGAVAHSSTVPIYRADQLHNQLNLTASRFLSTTVQVDVLRKKVCLPKVFQWYASDLGSSTMQQLEMVKKYSKGELNHNIITLLDSWSDNAKNKPSISYLDYKWKCRMLQPLVS